MPLDPREVYLKQLLEGCQRHDRASQKSLYKEFYSYGMGICLRYANNRDEAAEILNDGFMKIFSSFKRFNFDRPFKPWLRKILVNLSITRFHQRQRKLETEEITESCSESDDEKILSGISYQEVIEMLHKLPPSYRAAFNLHVVEGYSHEEIAVMLNITVGTSKSNLFKAKEHLKRIISEFFEVDYDRAR